LNEKEKALFKSSAEKVREMNNALNEVLK